MRPSQQPEGSTLLRDSTSTEEHLPLGPLKLQIQSSANRRNLETQLEETYYRIRFLDFDNEEKEYAEKELMADPAGVEALLKYKGCSPTTKQALQSPRRTSSRTSLQSSPLSSVRRASELRSSDQSRDAVRSLPPQNTGVLPTTPEQLEVDHEGALDALEWANQHYSYLPGLPEWQKSRTDLTPAPSGVEGRGMVQFEEVAGRPGANPQEGVVTVELPATVLLKFHNGETAQAKISEVTSGEFTTSP